MPIIDYPFVKIQGKPKPALCVKLINPANKFDHITWALIDTGADFTVIPEYIAKKLYHDIRNRNVRRDYCSGIGGGTLTYYHTFRLEIFQSDKKGNLSPKPVIQIKPRLYPVVEKCDTMVLGMGDFLKDYVLTINYSKKVFSVRKP